MPGSDLPGLSRDRARVDENEAMKRSRTPMGLLLARIEDEETAALDSRSRYPVVADEPYPR